MAANTEPVPPYRALGLDALRGFAILTMILSSRIPYGVLPGWMYHVQVPPPKHTFDPSIPGISWVDLVFPFFLFAMGAAFPLALSRRVESGMSKLKMSGQIIWRGILLMFFALVIMHARPQSFDPALSPTGLILALALFLCMFYFYWRVPSRWSPAVRYTLQFTGLAGLIVFLTFVRFPDLSGFSFKRYDIIILVLSNVAIAGSFIWLLTRNNLLARLAMMAGLLGIRLAFNSGAGWIHELGVHYPSWMLFQPYFLKYLFIIIPGTIAGDLILKFSKSGTAGDADFAGNKLRYGVIALLMFYLIYLSLAGLYTRLVWETTAAGISLCAIVYFLFSMGESLYDKHLKELFIWGMAWFIIGLLLEPFEGGIKKDPSTMAYYFVTSGLAVFMMIGFMIIVDVFRKAKWLGVLIDSGQNPMLAYAGGTNLLTPLVVLTGLDSLLGTLMPTPWLGALKGVLVTLLLGVIVQYFTRKKIYWRT